MLADVWRWISPQTIGVTERWREVAGTTSSMFDLSARSVGRVVACRAEAVGIQASGHSLRVGGWPRTWPPPAPRFRAVSGGTVAITDNGRSLHTLPGGRPGSSAPLLLPLLKTLKKAR